jgi:trehalose/maltose hydrolase-like predicted phosphorylase
VPGDRSGASVWSGWSFSRTGTGPRGATFIEPLSASTSYYAAGTAQYHINADIMYALRKYVQATGDELFLRDYGASSTTTHTRT